LGENLDCLSENLAPLQAHADRMRRAAATPNRMAATPCSFDKLLNHECNRADRSIVFYLHVPKTGGNTVCQLLRQNGYFQIDRDPGSDSFFYLVDEQRWFDERPNVPYVFAGHYGLDHPIFRRIYFPFVAITTLREPIDRMISHYNYAMRSPASPLHSEIVSGHASFLDHTEEMLRLVGPQFRFFAASRPNDDIPVQRCLENLLTKVSFYGLTERLDEFSTALGYLLGLSNVLHVDSRNVTAELPEIHRRPLKTSLTDRERQRLRDLLHDDIWFYERAREEYHRRMSDPRLKQALAHAASLRQRSASLMRQFRATQNPGDPKRVAFGVSDHS